MAAGAQDTTSILREFAASGALDSLERPNFSRYRDSVIRLYQSTGYRPVWLQGNSPKAQAKVIIGALERSESKGLDPRDYDGSSWSRRIAALPSGEPSAQAEFDLALTVCAMRYVSDLEFGRIREERFRNRIEDQTYRL